MSRGVNKVILIGNLGADPDCRTTASGSPVTNINIATDESYNDKQTGQKVERVEWHRVILWNRLAEIARDYLRKGSKVYVEGSLQTRKYNDNNGIERSVTEIIARDLQMLDSRQSGAQQPQTAPAQQGYQNPTYHPNRNQAQPSRQQPQAAPAPSGGAPDFDDDIPFMRLDSFV